MQTLIDAGKNHLVDAFLSLRCMMTGDDRRLRSMVLKDTGKCMLLGTVVFVGWQFGRGRTHYLKYVHKGVQGALLGLGYSFYFTARKVEAHEYAIRLEQIKLQQESTQSK